MTQQIRIGKVLLTKGGKWNAETLYPQLTFVIHNNDGWWSAHANVGSEPSADNHDWVQATDVNSLLTQIKQSEGELSDVLKTATADEQIRIEAELARVTAENGRAEAEAARAIAENSRVTAEVARAKAEDERNKAEDKRKGAEDKREHDFNSAMATFDGMHEIVLNAVNNADSKAEEAQAAANLANEKAALAQAAAESVDESKESALEAARHANDKAGIAQEAASLAIEKASTAQTAAALATEKAGIAQTAASNANEKAAIAQTAAENANDKAAVAQTAANNANEKAAIAQTAANNANDKAAIAQAAADEVKTYNDRLASLETGKQDDVTKLDETTEVDYLIGVQGGVAKKISAANISIETELHGMAWGIILNPNSANAELPVVGNYALWTEFKESIGRYQMNNSGKAIKLHPLDSSKYIDGTDIDTSKGHIMVHVPDLYYKVVEQSNGNSILWMSARPIGGHVIHTSGEGNGSWIGAYIGREVDGALVSKPSLNPTRSKTISSFFATAQVNGPDFGLSDYEHRQLMMMLYLSEYHNENSQACLGFGMNGNASNWVAGVYNALTGETSTLGDGCGSVAFHSDDEKTANACHISLFGIEDPYGWFWEMIQGCYFGNSGNEAQTGSEMFVYKGNRMPTSDELTTQPSGAFRQLTRPTSSGNVYALQMGDHFDVLPGKLGSGGWSDYHWANTTGQLLLWGGYAYNGSYCGLAYSDSYCAFSYANSAVAARLAYYGVATVVSRPTEL